MSYREPAAVAFSPRQLRWIEATTTEETVRVNLAGVAITTPRRTADRVERALFVSGGALLAGGAYLVLALASHSPVAVVPGTLVLAVATAKRVRRRRSLTEDFRIEVVTVVPRFETRTAVNVHGQTIAFESIDIDGEPMKWPKALAALSDRLAPGERLRVGIARHRAFGSVAWAYPVTP